MKRVGQIFYLKQLGSYPEAQTVSEYPWFCGLTQTQGFTQAADRSARDGNGLVFFPFENEVGFGPFAPELLNRFQIHNKAPMHALELRRIESQLEVSDAQVAKVETLRREHAGVVGLGLKAQDVLGVYERHFLVGNHRDS